MGGLQIVLKIMKLYTRGTMLFKRFAFHENW